MLVYGFVLLVSRAPQDSSTAPLYQLSVNFIGTRIGVSLFSSLFLWHLSQLLTTQQARTTHSPERSEALVGEEGTYFNVLLRYFGTLA